MSLFEMRLEQREMAVSCGFSSNSRLMFNPGNKQLLTVRDKMFSREKTSKKVRGILHDVNESS